MPPLSYNWPFKGVLKHVFSMVNKLDQCGCMDKDIRAKYYFLTDRMKLTIALHYVLPRSQCLFSNPHHPSCCIMKQRSLLLISLSSRLSSTLTLPLHLALFINAGTFIFTVASSMLTLKAFVYAYSFQVFVHYLPQDVHSPCWKVRSLFAGCSCAHPNIQAVHAPKHLAKWTFHHLVMCFPMKAKWLNESQKLRSHPILQTRMASKAARYVYLPFLFLIRAGSDASCRLSEPTWSAAGSAHVCGIVSKLSRFRCSCGLLPASQWGGFLFDWVECKRFCRIHSFFFFFKFRKIILGYFFFVAFQGTWAAVYLRSILVSSLFSFGAHERLCCFHFLHFLSTNTPRKIPTNPPKTPRLAGSNSCFLQRSCRKQLLPAATFALPLPVLYVFRRFRWWAHSSLQPYWTALKHSRVTPKFNASAQRTLVSDYVNIVSRLRAPGWSNWRGGT